jgi:hypothetical protein
VSSPALEPTRPLFEVIDYYLQSDGGRGIKRPMNEVNHSSPSSVEVKNGAAEPPPQRVASWFSV